MNWAPKVLGPDYLIVRVECDQDLESQGQPSRYKPRTDRAALYLGRLLNATGESRPNRRDRRCSCRYPIGALAAPVDHIISYRLIVDAHKRGV
jgi:hypothetical protein